MSNMRLIHGEALIEMDKLISQGVKVDAVITDIPYGITNCKFDVVIPFAEMWEKLKEISNPESAIVLFGSEPFSSALRLSNLKNYKYDWVWNKHLSTGHLNSKRMPFWILPLAVLRQQLRVSTQIETLLALKKTGGILKQAPKESERH